MTLLQVESCQSEVCMLHIEETSDLINSQSYDSKGI